MTELTREEIELVRRDVPDGFYEGLQEVCNMALRTHDAEARAEWAESDNVRLRADNEFLRKRRGQLVIERDQAREALATPPPEGEAQHPDDAAVDRFAAAMKAKLRHAREVKGRGGWDNHAQCRGIALARMLVDHLQKGNPGTFEDVANFAMMLHQRNEAPETLKLALLEAEKAASDRGYRYAERVYASQDTEDEPHTPCPKHTTAREALATPSDEQEVGCEDQDGLLHVHPAGDTCEVCHGTKEVCVGENAADPDAWDQCPHCDGSEQNTPYSGGLCSTIPRIMAPSCCSRLTEIIRGGHRASVTCTDPSGEQLTPEQAQDELVREAQERGEYDNE